MQKAARLAMFARGLHAKDCRLVGPPAWSDRRPGRTAGLVGPPVRQPASPPACEPASLRACEPASLRAWRVLQCSMVGRAGLALAVSATASSVNNFFIFCSHACKRLANHSPHMRPHMA